MIADVQANLRMLYSFYTQKMRLAAMLVFQYRVGTFFWMIGLVIEPVIYLVVWTTVAREQGGAIGGFTLGDFVAYYWVWTIMRVMNIGMNPLVFEWRVKEGQWSPMLLRPIHPIHDDFAFLLGHKSLDLILLVPILTGLWFAFQPDLNPTWWQIGLFVVACLLGYFVRSIWQWALGLATFWFVRVRAIFDLYFAFELLLSGRIVPLDLLPDWAQTAANFLPYQWSFAFPIEVLIGRQSFNQSVAGIGWQLVWIIGGWFFVMFLWRRGVRKYSAVGA